MYAGKFPRGASVSEHDISIGMFRGSITAFIAITTEIAKVAEWYPVLYYTSTPPNPTSVDAHSLVCPVGFEVERHTKLSRPCCWDDANLYPKRASLPVPETINTVRRSRYATFTVPVPFLFLLTQIVMFRMFSTRKASKSLNA